MNITEEEVRTETQAEQKSEITQIEVSAFHWTGSRVFFILGPFYFILFILFFILFFLCTFNFTDFRSTNNGFRSKRTTKTR